MSVFTPNSYTELDHYKQFIKNDKKKEGGSIKKNNKYMYKLLKNLS